MDKSPNRSTCPPLPGGSLVVWSGPDHNLSGLSGLGVVWPVQHSLCSLQGVGRFGRLMFEEVFEAFMALYGFDFCALRG